MHDSIIEFTVYRFKVGDICHQSLVDDYNLFTFDEDIEIESCTDIHKEQTTYETVGGSTIVSTETELIVTRDFWLFEFIIIPLRNNHTGPDSLVEEGISQCINENEFFNPFREDLIKIAKKYLNDVEKAATFLTLWDYHLENMGREFDDLYDEFECRFDLVGEIDPNKLSNCLKD